MVSHLNETLVSIYICIGTLLWIYFWLLGLITNTSGNCMVRSNEAGSVLETFFTFTLFTFVWPLYAPYRVIVHVRNKSKTIGENSENNSS